MTQAELIPPNEISLAEHAAVIRMLGKRVVSDVVEIGRRLTECRTQLKRGAWGPWLKREFKGLSEDTALNFMNLYKATATGSLQIPNGSVFNIKSLYLLAAPSTSDEARAAVLDKAKNGAKLTRAQVKKMIADARKIGEAELSKAEKRHAEELQQAERSFKAREVELRKEYKDRLPVEEIEQLIERTTAPLVKKIESLRERIKKKESTTTTTAPVEPKPYRNEQLDLVASVDHLSVIPSCGLKVLAERTPELIEHYLSQALKASDNLGQWIRELREANGGKGAT